MQHAVLVPIELSDSGFGSDVEREVLAKKARSGRRSQRRRIRRGWKSARGSSACFSMAPTRTGGSTCIKRACWSHRGPVPFVAALVLRRARGTLSLQKN